MGFAFNLADWFTANADDIDRGIRRYFEGQPGGRFTGRWFEDLAAMSDPNRLEASDIVAVDSLSVSIDSEIAATLLLRDPERFNGLLREIPREQDMWELRRLDVNVGSAADKLWCELDAIPEVGWVTAGKLLAAKRPRLIPILDDRVKNLLKPKEGSFWISMWDELADPSRRSAIADVCRAAPPHVSLLRRMDVAFWMAAAPAGR